MIMDISGILSQVRSSSAFINPLSSQVNAALSLVSIPSLVDLTTLANAQSAAQGSLVPTELQLQTAHNSIVNATNKVNDLLGHTDKLSGVNLSGNGTLATIAKTMQSAKGINGETSCSTALAAFGAITKSAELITSTVDTINQIKDFLEDIPHQVEIVTAQTEAFANKVVKQIADDEGALAQAQVDIIEHAVAQSMVSLFQDECASQVLAAVMTAPMHQEVTSVVDKIKAKKLISISGK